MWTLSAPFDGEVGDVSFQKVKLLKTGTTYNLGRKGCSLLIANKKVSSHHCDFKVEDFTWSDAGDPTSRPTLVFTHNKKDKGIRVARQGSFTVVNALELCELYDGDVISLVSGVYISIKWTTVCCYVQPVMGKSPVSVETCASLGVHIVHVANPHVTHHLLPSYTAQPIVAASLLSACHFAKLEWLQEVLRLGSLPKDADLQQGVPLENSFNLPPLSKYRPAYSPSLLTSQKEPRVWEPNEERLKMFLAYRFLWVDEKARLGDFKEVIERGGGSFETFEAAAGKLKFHRALTRGQAKEGKKQIIVGKEKSIVAAIGQGLWKVLVEEAKSFGLHIHEPEVILQVVIDADTSLFDNQVTVTSMDVDEVQEAASAPDSIPNTQSQDPSASAPESHQRPGLPKKLVRRVSSRQASREPSLAPNKTSELEEQQELPRPRKALTRRINAGLPLIIGIDDPSVSLESTPNLPILMPSSPLAKVDSIPPTPARPSNLKRRLKTGASDTLMSQGIVLPTTLDGHEEPPLKKFKALFDASYPDNVGSGTFDEDGFDDNLGTIHETSDQTQTQSQTQRKASQPGRHGVTGSLSPLREEEETPSSVVMTHGTKRGLDQDQETVSGPKKRVVEGVNSLGKPTDSKLSLFRGLSQPLSGAAPNEGAAPGQPDQDVNFLKAIASTKRGRKVEDDFDRDFNRLKISKPDLKSEELEDQWAVVADFGDDTGVRGNFMVIVEMQAYNRGRGNKGNESNTEWQGKPNFKKFKKKGEALPKARVELLLSEGNDYGMGAAYWKPESQAQGTSSQNQQTALDEVEAVTRNSTLTKTQTQMINDSDEDIIPYKGKSKTAASSRASSAAPPRRAPTRSKLSKKPLPLFIESDGDENELQTLDDEENLSVLVDSDDEQTLRSTRSRPATRRSTRAPPKKPVPILVDDDSDDGAVFKGFNAKQRR